MKPERLVFPALRWQESEGFVRFMPMAHEAVARGVGGFIIFGGPADAVAELTDDLTARAGRPLLFAADLERGAGQQFRGLSEVPPPGALGWLNDEAVTRAAGSLTASEARSIGINWVLAPVADLDIEVENPIVQTRSFGHHPSHVARHVSAWIQGCQTSALSCVKHYPGHGRTATDSHLGVPVVDATAEALEDDLFPFSTALHEPVDAVMTSHISFPALDGSGTAATFSPSILQDLRAKGFEGLITTDALMMEGAREGHSPVEAAVKALRAGVDILLYPPEPLAVLEGIAGAVTSNRRLHEQVERSLDRLRATVNLLLGRSVASDRATMFEPTALADRLLAGGLMRTSGVPELRPPIELRLVDDDQEGAWPPSSNGYLAARLEAHGIPLGPGGSAVLCTFAEPRAGKPWGGFGRRSWEVLVEEGPRAEMVVHFGHRRLARKIPGTAPVLVAWHRQRLMQEAAADWIREHLP